MDSEVVNGLTFEHWLDNVNSVVQRRLGVGYLDLADWRWYDAWADEMSPADAADEAISEEFSDYGW